jgi:hypothetical protein
MVYEYIQLYLQWTLQKFILILYFSYLLRLSPHHFRYGSQAQLTRAQYIVIQASSRNVTTFMFLLDIYVRRPLLKFEDRITFSCYYVPRMTGRSTFFAPFLILFFENGVALSAIP